MRASIVASHHDLAVERTVALQRVVGHYAAGERASRLLDIGQARWMTEAPVDTGAVSGPRTATDAIAWVDAELAHLVGVVGQAASRSRMASALSASPPPSPHR
jgi:hypothetical protein